jgi:hypothetical protein
MPKMGLGSAYFHFLDSALKASTVYSGVFKSIESAFAYTKSVVIDYYLGTLDSSYLVERSYMMG